MQRFVILAFVLALLGGCRGTVVDHVGIDVRLPTAPQCRDVVGPITLTALGDFPTTDIDVAQLDSSGMPIDPLTRFRPATLAFSVSSHASAWEAFGWGMRSSIELDPIVVLLPLGRSCPLADSEARLPTGAAIAVIDDARVMFVGGLDETGAATRRVAILHARDESVELPRMDGALRTAFATATLAPERDAVLVTGGAARVAGDALPTWERIPLDGGALTFGALRDARRDHAAIAVDVGRVHGVLLVGGSNGASPLRSIEWIDPTTGRGDLLASVLAAPGRVAPSLVMLDATHVAIVGGTDGAGGLVSGIEVLDVAADTISPVEALDAPTPDWIAALPSGRLAWVATFHDPLDDMPGEIGTHLLVVSIDPPRRDRAVAHVPVVLDPQAVALDSGRVLLEGHRLDGTRLGYVIDPGAGTVTTVDTSRVPTRLVALADGSTLELAATAASLRRDERATPFDAPPPSYLFGPDRASLALDAASRWTVTGAALAPASGVEDARLDIPVLRLRHFEATLDAEGALDVLLTGDHLETLATVSVTHDAVSVGTCSVPRADGRHVRVGRAIDGDLVVGTEQGTVVCALPAVDPSARLGIGIVAHQDALLHSLELTRDLF